MKLHSEEETFDISDPEFNFWLFKIISKYSAGRILHLGSNESWIYDLFIENNVFIHLSNSDYLICQKLSESFKGIEPIRAIHQIDLTKSNFQQLNSYIKGAFGTILLLSMNKQPDLSDSIIANINFLLQKWGRLIVITLSQTVLFNNSDFDWKELKKVDRPLINKMLHNNYDILKTIYFISHSKSSDKETQPGLPSVIVIGKKTENKI